MQKKTPRSLVRVTRRPARQMPSKPSPKDKAKSTLIFSRMPKKMLGTVEPISIAVCYGFAEYMDKERKTYVSADRVARELGVSVATVNRSIAELYRQGWLKAVGKRGRSVIREVVLHPQPITGDSQTPITHDRPSRISELQPVTKRQKTKTWRDYPSGVESLCKPAPQNAKLPGDYVPDKAEAFHEEHGYPF